MMMRQICLSCILLVSALLNAKAQSESQFSEAIEDNSYYIEEAYNQEKGIVQHISNGIYIDKTFLYSFTQEWPMWGQTHQFSYTVPISFTDPSGVGDILLNYRNQVWDQSNWMAFSPRFSLSLPVGNKDKGLGQGVLGVQVNLPFSKRVSEKFVVHANLGATMFLGKTGSDLSTGKEVKESPLSFNIGASVIWLATSRLNIMLELLNNQAQDINAIGKLETTPETIISPGFRYAIDIGELQIVPGIAIPFSMSGGGTTNGVFFYLSFEHPF